MKISKSTENLTCIEIFQRISKRQVLALMFHDQMCDLYGFLGLQGFKCWHKHQYKSESDEFLKTKEYFISSHNRLLGINDPGQPEAVIPGSWYTHTRLDINSQLVHQYVELSFDKYKSWEEETKRTYEDYSQALLEMGHIADAEQVNILIQDVSQELQELYKMLIQLKAVDYDPVYILDIQDKIRKKYK